jgi:hypothetical protein
MLLQVVCFGIFLCENQGILFNVLDILSQLHEDMLPMSVTITYWLHFDYCGPLCYPILYDDGSLIHI